MHRSWGHPLALTVKRANALCPNFFVGSFQTRGPELQARFDPVISVVRFQISSLEGIRSVIHLVLALKNSGSLLRSCHRELFPRPAQCPRSGIQKTFSAGLCPFTFCVCSSETSGAGSVQPLPGSQRGRITLNSVPQSGSSGINTREYSNRKGPALKAPVPFRLFFSRFFFLTFLIALRQSPRGSHRRFQSHLWLFTMTPNRFTAVLP